jgi:hypothetical protein
MIDMRVGDRHRVDLRRIEAELVTVVPLVFIAPLKHAALDQHRRAIGLEEIARAGHLAGRAEKLQLHKVPLLVAKG